MHQILICHTFRKLSTRIFRDAAVTPLTLALSRKGERGRWCYDRSPARGRGDGGATTVLPKGERGRWCILPAAVQGYPLTLALSRKGERGRWGTNW
ncbi:MAG: hypothetical protein KBB65_08440 [Syntrophorhabdaceae bacterium]|nr:hypothetical protein [Syntrophorhabdaceae bacterium]